MPDKDSYRPPRYLRVVITYYLDDGGCVMGTGETLEEAEIQAKRQVEYYAKQRLERARRG